MLLEPFVWLTKLLPALKSVASATLCGKEYTIQYHIRAFQKLCSKLQGYTNRCVISFIDLYKKTERNTKSLNIINMTTDDINQIAAEFFYSIGNYICNEVVDKSSVCIL